MGGADESVRKFGCSHAKSREGRATAIIAGKYLEGDAPFVSLRFPSPESVRREFESSTVVWVIEFGQLRVAERDGSRAECLKNLESEARGVIPRSKRDSREIPEILPRPRRKEEREREGETERERDVERRRIERERERGREGEGRGGRKKILFRGSWIGLVSSMDLTVYVKRKDPASLKGRSHCKNRAR